MLGSRDYKRVWKQLWDLYRTSNVAIEKETVLWSLGCVKDEELLKR